MRKLYSSHVITSQLVLASLFVAVISYLMLWLTDGRSAPFHIPVSSDASSMVMLLATLVPFLLFLGVVGAAGYIALRRKISILAAIATGLLASALSNAALLMNTEREVLLATSLFAIASTMAFYGFYTLLAQARKPKVVGLILLAGTGVISLGVSLAVLYAMRVSQGV